MIPEGWFMDMAGTRTIVVLNPASVIFLQSSQLSGFFLFERVPTHVGTHVGSTWVENSR